MFYHSIITGCMQYEYTMHLMHGMQIVGATEILCFSNFSEHDYFELSGYLVRLD